jgi:hypothetical protein
MAGEVDPQPARSGIPHRVWDAMTPEQQASERRECDHVDKLLAAMVTIQETRALIGAIRCPVCEVDGALHFKNELRRGRRSSSLVLRAKCATPGCLEFLS